MSFVVMELRGRLGNNLWQFASGLGIARALGAELCFDRHRIADPELLLPNLIGAHYREVTAEELRRVGRAPFGPGLTARLTRAALRRACAFHRRALRRTGPEIILYDRGDEFLQELFELDLPAYVAGYFQNEQFITAVTDEVAQAIRWPADTPTLPELGPTIAVSFRRGDYNLFAGHTIPVDYYDRAMQLVVDRVGETTFVLFGDDHGFIEIFGERAERRGYSVTSALQFGADPIAQLRMLSECDHVILANSSFAWWGAWLGDQRGAHERTVIAPAGWKHRVREHWIAVEEVPGQTFTYDFSTPSPLATLT